MLKKLKPKSEFSRSVLTLMTGTTIAQAIPIAISPILTRIYTPEDFGVFALYMSLAVIFSVIVTGRYELAIMLPKKDSDAVYIVFLSVLITLIMSVLTFLIMFFFNANITNLLGNRDISNWLYFIPISVFLSGIYQSLSYWKNRKKGYNEIAISRVSQSSTGATSNLLLGYSGFGSAGLILSSIVSQVVATVILGKSSFDKHKKVKRVSKTKLIALAKKYKKFPIYNTQHALVNIVFSQMPIFIFSKFFNASMMGYYALSIRVIQTPISIMGSAFGNVLYEKIVNKRNNKQKYMSQIYKFLQTQILLAIVLFLSIYFLSNYMEIIFGKNWSEVGVYIKLLIPWLFMVFMVSPLAFSINMTSNQAKGLFLEWVYGGIKLGSLLLGAIYFADVHMTLIIFSIANALFLMYQGTWFINLLKKEEK